MSSSQALLLFSVSYGCGVTAEELSQMRVSSLLDCEGKPASQVHVAPETTKHRNGRRVPMHPDVRRDLLDFRNEHPLESFVAFASTQDGVSLKQPISAHALTKWFRSLYREAGFERLTVRSGRRTFLLNQMEG
jgi:integrase